MQTNQNDIDCLNNMEEAKFKKKRQQKKTKKNTFRIKTYLTILNNNLFKCVPLVLFLFLFFF